MFNAGITEWSRDSAICGPGYQPGASIATQTPIAMDSKWYPKNEGEVEFDADSKNTV